MLNSVYKEVSEELGIPEEVVRKAYISYWQFIKSKIKELPLMEDLSDEEFNKLKTNFNVPSLGKLSCTLERYKNVRKGYEYNKSEKN